MLKRVTNSIVIATVLATLFNTIPANAHHTKAWRNRSRRNPSTKCVGARLPNIKKGQIRRKTGYTECGIASWYGKEEHGGLVANYPERYNMWGISAASNTIKLGTCVSIYNLTNGKSVHGVRINDTGGFSRLRSRVNGKSFPGRVIDTSRRVARLLNFEGKGLEEVRVKVTGFVGRKARKC